MDKVRILLNGEDRKVLRVQSYADLAAMAGIDIARRPTITYDLPTGGNGSLRIGQSISVTAGTIINIQDTSKA